MKKSRQLRTPNFASRTFGTSNRTQNLMANPQTREAATEQITQMIQESGVPAWAYAEVGRQAEMALMDKSKYPMFVKFMVQRGLDTEENLKKPDPQMLAMLVTIGKVAETLPDSDMPTQPQAQG
jgi:hypothetical protein